MVLQLSECCSSFNIDINKFRNIKIKNNFYNTIGYINLVYIKNSRISYSERCYFNIRIIDSNNIFVITKMYCFDDETNDSLLPIKTIFIFNEKFINKRTTEILNIIYNNNKDFVLNIDNKNYYIYEQKPMIEIPKFVQYDKLTILWDKNKRKESPYLPNEIKEILNQSKEKYIKSVKEHPTAHSLTLNEYLLCVFQVLAFNVSPKLVHDILYPKTDKQLKKMLRVSNDRWYKVHFSYYYAISTGLCGNSQECLYKLDINEVYNQFERAMF